MTLFDLDPAGATEGYLRLREDGREEDRARLDEMYGRASAYLDANFRDQFVRATNDRFFELRLADALLDHGFELEIATAGRPDFATRLPDGRRLWLEAVGLSWGCRTTRIVRPPFGKDSRLRRSDRRCCG